MENWTPTDEQGKYLNLVLSMTTDCLEGNGTDTVNTYNNNLGIIMSAIQTEDTETAPCPACGKALRKPSEYLDAMSKMRKAVDAFRVVLIEDYYANR